MSRRLAGVAIPALFLCGPIQAPSAAQAPPPEPVSASAWADPQGYTIRAQDPADSTGRYKDHQVELAAGQAIQIDITSGDADMALDVFERPGGPRLGGNDDGGDSLNARWRFTAPQTGTYIIRARAMGVLPATYYLKISALEPGGSSASELKPGVAAKGELTADSPRVGNNNPYALYRFAGEAGERYRLEMRSFTDGLDPRIEVSRPDDESILAEGDDFDETLNARLLLDLPASGTYIVRAIGLSEGEFDLKLEKLITSAVGTPVLKAGDSIPDTLKATDPAVYAHGSQISGFYRSFRVPVRKGDRMTAVLRSAEFAGVLEAGVETALGFAVAASSAGTVTADGSSVLTYTARAAGEILLRVRSVGSQTGAFTLSLAPAAAASAAH